ncbi:MAG: hypothetical protein RIR31_1555, partial [Bacteroidota bacterium]
MLHIKKIATILTALSIIQLSIIHLQAQPLKKTATFSHADTLRGTYGPSRDWWDVLKYDLHVKFNILDSTISGYNVIQFKALKKGDVMQIDLQEPMILDSIIYTFNGKWMDERFKVDFSKNGDAHFFSLPDKKQAGKAE